MIVEEGRVFSIKDFAKVPLVNMPQNPQLFYCHTLMIRIILCCYCCSLNQSMYHCTDEFAYTNPLLCFCLRHANSSMVA